MRRLRVNYHNRPSIFAVAKTAMPVDVLGSLRGKILFEQGWNADADMCRVVVGAFGQSAEQRKIDGTPPLPFVQIRARGGPRSANWTAEGLRRVDVFGFGKSYDEADALSQSVDDYLVNSTITTGRGLRRGPQPTQICRLR